MFRTRGIRGVWAFVLGEVDYDQWNWDWNRFAFIHSGHEPRRRIVDVVDAEDRANIRLLFESLASRGYRRIGVATTRGGEAQSLFELSAGRVRFGLEHPGHPAFAPCLVRAYDKEGARRIGHWIRRHRVDCLASRWRGIEKVLSDLGFRTPEDIGLAYVTVHGNPAETGSPSGIDVQPAAMAEAAIETLVAAVEQHRHGLPVVPRQILIPGRWRQGRTCRADA
jgi:DNA-binding LacI/PurR family transcriptional regulator